LRHGIGFVPCAPDEFEIARVEFARDYIVDECLRPCKDWRQALFFGKLLLGFGGGAVDRLRESLGRNRKSKADDAREPFVERPLELGLLRLDEGLRDSSGNEFGPPAAAKIAIEIGIPIFLLGGDLIRCPAFWDANQTVGNISFGEIIEKV